jgi:hypothetical protein
MRPIHLPPHRLQVPSTAVSSPTRSTSAAEAAKIILDCLRADRLRILVGPDAHIIDRMVRENPDHSYEPEFYERFATEAGRYPGH